MARLRLGKLYIYLIACTDLLLVNRVRNISECQLISRFSIIGYSQYINCLLVLSTYPSPQKAPTVKDELSKKSITKYANNEIYSFSLNLLGIIASLYIIILF